MLASYEATWNLCEGGREEGGDSQTNVVITVLVVGLEEELQRLVSLLLGDHLDDLMLAVLGTDVEECVVILVLNIQPGPTGYQDLHHVMVTLLTSDHQRSEPLNIPLVQIAASEVKMPSVITLIKCLLPFYQHLNNINIFTVLAVELGILGVVFSIGSCQVQRGLQHAVSPVNLGSVVQQQRNCISVSAPAGEM